jgi:hypothetical protein
MSILKIISQQLKQILFLLFVMSSASSLADQPKAVGPHGGQVVEDEKHKIELKLNQKQKTVDVYILKSESAEDSRPSVLLVDRSNEAHTIELKAVKDKQPVPHFQGNLGPWSGSYAGFEISIPLPFQKKKTFQIKEPKKD